MKIFDFDEKFFEYTRTWIAMHPKMTEKQLEESYNEILLNWLNAPAKWLGGEKPGEYFLRYSDPKDLMKLLEEYDKRDIGLPEPLYSRVVSLGEPCVEPLMRMVRSESNSESLRATALAILRDIGSDKIRPMLIDLVCQSEEADEISEMALDQLSAGDASVVDALLERYDEAAEYGRMAILDICSNFPGDERVYQKLVSALRNLPDDRALYAALLGKYGDARAIEALKPFLTMQDIGYLDYIEVRNAVEELGGDAGEERAFYGDPDYEAMRGM